MSSHNSDPFAITIRKTLFLILVSSIIEKSLCVQQPHPPHEINAIIDEPSEIKPQSPIVVKKSSAKCQEITIPMCKSIRYNYTEMPNSFNHETQEEAGLEVHQYWPLVEIKCSSDLKFFICSLYVPICMEDYIGTVPPCRSVCERARAGCEPVMTQYGFFWPERMACDQFPKFGKNSICMDEKGGEMPSSTNSVAVASIVPVQKSKLPSTPSKPTSQNCSTSCTCNYPLVRIPKSSYISIRGAANASSSIITTGSVQNCLLPCRGYGYSSPDEIRFANYWLTFWSSVTTVLSTVTVLTFAIDSSRFNYPERPIILISFCYIFVGVGYLTRIYYGHEAVACGGGDSPVVRYPGVLISPYQSNSQICTVVFLLTYYFTISGSYWFVVLTGTWYLASVLKWSTEAISEKSGVFHALVWVSSAVITLAVLLTDSIDGDSISGICFVGSQDRVNLLAYVLVPMGGLLLIGTVFLVSGFVSLLRIRSVIAREVRNFHKLEKLMIRIGVFGVLYTVNCACVLGGFGYEAWVRGEWVGGVNCGGNKHKCGNNNSELVINMGGYAKPAYSVLMIKYFMSLATGLTASIWVFSSKTVETWKSFLFNRILFLCVRNNKSRNSKQTSSVTTGSTANSAATAAAVAQQQQQSRGSIHHLQQHHHLHVNSSSCSKQTHV